MASDGSMGVLMAGAAIKGATTATAKTFIEQVITPYLRGLKSKKSETTIKRNLSKYTRLIDRKTRAIPTFASTSGALLLEDIYEPLTVKNPANGLIFTIDGYPSKLLEESRCIAITDDAGMGKSTLAKYIARMSINERKLIPLLIELRRIRQGQSIISCLCDELASAPLGSIESESLIELFQNGNFLFILDGFDEVEESLRPALVKEINEISSVFEFCYFILTSRPEYAVSLFHGFYPLGICKLTKDQAHSLIKRYDCDRGLSKILIPRINEADVGEFLGNPLLVTLLYRAFDHRNSVPPKRTIFFRQVYDSLFQDHDLAKGDAFSRKKESDLDSEDFHKLVRSIGFETFKSGRVSYRIDEMAEIIKKSTERSDIKVDIKKVSSDLLKAVPLFLRDGMEIKWSHKSFQEYFASQYILIDTGVRRPEIITKMFNSIDVQRYREIFRFFGEFDTGLMRELCISPLIQEISSIPGSEMDFQLASIHYAVDIFYLGSTKPSNKFETPSSLIKNKLGIDIEERATATIITTTENQSFTLISALKEHGRKYLLLSSIDPKIFPAYTRGDRQRFISSWKEILGDKVLHINPSMQEFIQNIKGMKATQAIQSVEAAALLYSISNEAIRIITESASQRKKALMRCILDEF